jgi:hypothetical protein
MDYVTREAWTKGRRGRPDAIDEVADTFERPGAVAFWERAWQRVTPDADQLSRWVADRDAG